MLILRMVLESANTEKASFGGIDGLVASVSLATLNFNSPKVSLTTRKTNASNHRKTGILASRAQG